MHGQPPDSMIDQKPKSPEYRSRMPARRSCAQSCLDTAQSPLVFQFGSFHKSLSYRSMVPLPSKFFFVLRICTDPCIRDQRKLDWTFLRSAAKRCFQAPLGQVLLATLVSLLLFDLQCLSMRTVVKVGQFTMICIALAVHTRPMQDGYHLSATPYGEAVSSCSSDARQPIL